MRQFSRQEVRPKLLPSAVVVAAVSLLALLRSAGAAPQQDPPHDGGPYRVKGDVTRPELISRQPRPEYPPLARRFRISGVVIVESVIDQRGNVTQVRVLRGQPLGLSRAAVDALKQWKFKPATLDGRPVRVFYVLTVNFQVSGGSPALGPGLLRFLDSVPDFRTSLALGLFADAARILDDLEGERPPAELVLARVYLLLRQGLLEAAWAEARSHQVPDPYEIFNLVGAFAWDEVLRNRQQGPEILAPIVELGLEAESHALEARRDGWEAMLYKSLLLREKANLTPEAGARLALVREAERLERRGVRLFRAQGGQALLQTIEEGFQGDAKVNEANEETNVASHEER